MTQTNDWWTPFFTQFFGGVQLDEDKAEVTRREVDALERLLSLSGPMRILDVPCGTGRHTLELARRGHQVTGVDFNPQVLDAGRARATSEGLNAEFRQADMRRLDYDAVFDCGALSLGQLRLLRRRR